MQGSHYCEKGEGRCKQIACKEAEEDEVADEHHRFSRETVHYVSAEGTDEYGHNRIACKNKPYGVLARAEGLAKIKRQQRDNESERKFDKKIAYADFDEVCIP